MNNASIDSDIPSCAMSVESSQISSRLYYMDNLRALAMLLGVVFHAALAYSPRLNESWFTSDQQNSILLEFSVYFLHLFRMPLFFFISGFFALMMIEKKVLRPICKTERNGSYYPLCSFYP
jgi:glucan biosynthesis protein C